MNAPNDTVLVWEVSKVVGARSSRNCNGGKKVSSAEEMKKKIQPPHDETICQKYASDLIPI